MRRNKDCQRAQLLPWEVVIRCNTSYFNCRLLNEPYPKTLNRVKYNKKAKCIQGKWQKQSTGIKSKRRSNKSIQRAKKTHDMTIPKVMWLTKAQNQAEGPGQILTNKTGHTCKISFPNFFSCSNIHAHVNCSNVLVLHCQNHGFSF